MAVPWCLRLLGLLISEHVAASARKVTISGQSAGGSMAMQHLFAFSSSVDGAAIAAGSPYGCGLVPDSGDICSYGPIDVQGSIDYANWRAARHEIDDLSNLRDVPVMLFNGKQDWIVFVEVMKGVARQIAAFTRHDLITRRFGTNAAHVWSVNHGPCACGACEFETGSLECCDVNNCNYELTAETLGIFYGKLAPPAPKPTSPLRWIDQHAYLPHGSNETWSSHGMWKWGFAYLPAACRSRPDLCNIHIHYHGCIKKIWNRRHLWARLLDIDTFAETNDIIVFYPQAAGDKRTGIGCWNWLSKKSDPHFDTRQSVQLRTVRAIAADLVAALERSFEVVSTVAAAEKVPDNATASYYDMASASSSEVLI